MADAQPTKESRINLNTVILGLLLGLSSWHLKRLNDGLDKIHVVETRMSVSDEKILNTNSHVSEIKDKMKQRDSQWEKLESAVSDIRFKLASLTRTE